MPGVEELYGIIDELAPFAGAEPYDNSGILYNGGRDTGRILFALDITGETIAEAVELGCGLLISHHPVLFGGAKYIDAGDPIACAIRNNISLIAAHTNLDRAKNGTSDSLAKKIELMVTGETEDGLGRIGVFEKALSPQDFCSHIMRLFGLRNLLVVPGVKQVQKVAVLAGAGGNLSAIAADRTLSVDAIVTGETSYHHALEAGRNGITLVALGHCLSEIPGLMCLKAEVEKQLGDRAECFFSVLNTDPFRYLQY